MPNRYHAHDKKLEDGSYLSMVHRHDDRVNGYGHRHYVNVSDELGLLRVHVAQVGPAKKWAKDTGDEPTT